MNEANEPMGAPFERVWAAVPLDMPLAEVAAFARRAEGLGFDGIAVADAIHDGPMTAALVATATERVTIRSSGFVAFARSPYTTAIAAWDLHALSNGRFEIGLGPLVRPIIVDRYSVAWTPPAPRLREYVQSMQAIFDCWQNGTPLHYEGEHYRFTRMQDYMKPPRLDHLMPRVIIAGIGPNMTAVAGELADGINTHITNSDPVFLEQMTLPNLRCGADRTGRDPREISIIVNSMCATGPDEQAVLRSREAARALLAILYSTREYRHSLELHGWNGLDEHLRRMIREGRWGELSSEITDEMLDVFVPTGTYDELPAILRDRYDGLASEIGLPLGRPEDDDAVGRMIEECRG